MSGKNEKKIRQLYRRNVGDVTDQFLRSVMRPRPKWIPAMIWYWLMNIFIKIRTEKNGKN